MKKIVLAQNLKRNTSLPTHQNKPISKNIPDLISKRWKQTNQIQNPPKNQPIKIQQNIILNPHQLPISKPQNPFAPKIHQEAIDHHKILIEKQFNQIIIKLDQIQFHDADQSNKNQSMFDKLQNQFMDCIKHKINFTSFKPIPLDQVGQKLIYNGKFLRIWCKLILINPYITSNSKKLISKLYTEYGTKVNSDSQYYNRFISQQLQNSTSKKYINNGINTSRIKNITPTKKNQSEIQISIDSTKKQLTFDQFLKINNKSIKKNLTPKPQQILNAIDEKKQLSKQQCIKPYDQFLIDYLQINDIYFLRELKIVGIIENDFRKKGAYSILLVKIKDENSNYYEKQLFGIMNLKHEGSHDINVLKQIQKNWVIQLFVISDSEIQRDLHSYWVNNAETQI